MDFVDLDKVLDQFEEEEKAAGELCLGQESMPSQCPEGQAKQQDITWMTVSYAKQQDITWKSISCSLPSDSNSFKEHHSSLQPSSVYVGPYDIYGGCASSKSVAEFPSPGVEEVTNTRSGHLTSSADCSGQYLAHNGVPTFLPAGDAEQSICLQEQSVQSRLKQGTVESCMGLQLNGSAFEQAQGVEPGKVLELPIKLRSGEENEKRGLIASLPVSVQTDSLSPASEHELMCSPLPRTNILVTGHGETTVKQDGSSGAENESEQMNVSAEDCFSDAQNSEMTGTAGSAGLHASLSTVLGEVSCAVDRKLDVSGTLLIAEKVRAHTPHSERQEGGERREIQVDPGLQQNSDDQKMHLGCDEPGITLHKQADKQLSAGELVVTGAVTCQATGEPMVIGFKEEMVDIDVDAVKTYLDDLERSPVTDVTESHDQQDASQAGVVEDASLCRIAEATPPHPGLDDNVPSSMEGVTEAYSTRQACLQTFPEDETSFTAVKVQDTQEIWDPNAYNSSISGQELCDPSCSDSSVSGQEPCDPNANNSSVSGHNMEVKFCHLNTQKAFDAASEQRMNVDIGDSCGSETTESGQHVSGHEVANSFETFSFPTNDSGFSVGKLEIECLLDEILAAKMKSVVQGSGAPGDQTATSENSKASLASHSTMFEEPGVASREAAEHVQPQDNQNGCPAQGMGMGARPKERSQMKRSRPNSLLGLSKISLGGPSAGTQSPQIAAQQMVNGAMAQPSGAGDQVLPLVQGLPPLPVSTGVALTTDSCLTPSPGVGQEVSVPEHQVATSELSGSGVVELDAPVMRRQEVVAVGETMEASFGGPRPRSWSPAAVASQPAQKLKRPTSLNLPVRQDFSVAGGLSPESSSLQTRKSGTFPEKGSDTCSSEDSVAVGDVDDGKRRQEELEGLTGAGSEVAMETSRQPILHMNLGRVAPTWVPDGEAPTCMECDARFTFTKRRHHCRACGKVFCSSCCNLKSRLPYLDNKEGRVCIPCHHMLAAAESVRPAGGPCGSPNPNNPTEYCSTVPPTQQASAGAPLPTVMVPTGVLKREGSNKKSEPKQVMFSDGIRPGGDLTELDGSDQAHIPPRRSGRVQKKVERPQGGQSSPKTRRMRGSEGTRNPCLVPEEGLPPVATQGAANGDLTLTENPDLALLMTQIRDEEASPVTFAINRNLLVLVKIINLDCCVHRVVWCFTTQGMANVGQDELVVVLETLPDENTIPRDIFCHFSAVYEEAGKGNKVGHMGHTIFTQQFLDNRSHGGFLYVRASFQCTHKLLLPPPPFLFAVLLQKWETPWAKVFPVRLMLRLGAEYRYYPCPLVSIRNRKPVFYEIGHTIMNLLADFRNFQYMLPQISGVTIHMEDKKTLINFPRNRYQEVMKVVASSNEHVMALGASFSLEADSHLVCIQNEDCNYHTQAINIQNKPRKVTGASFVVFNGALKTSAGLRAKSSIVEDGLMVQILPETMAALKQAMKDMVDFSIGCGSASAAQPDELVVVRWVEEDRNVNIGVKSSVDGMSLDGVESIRVHNAADYISDSCAIRWTEVFFIQTESGSSRWEPVDLSHMAETLASAACVALTPQLEQLKQAGLVRIGLRVSLESERVGYEVGSNGESVPDFYMNALDNALIPVIHGAVSSSRDGPIVLELVFHIIN